MAFLTREDAGFATSLESAHVTGGGGIADRLSLFVGDALGEDTAHFFVLHPIHDAYQKKA